MLNRQNPIDAKAIFNFLHRILNPCPGRLNNNITRNLRTGFCVLSVIAVLFLLYRKYSGHFSELFVDINHSLPRNWFKQ